MMAFCRRARCYEWQEIRHHIYMLRKLRRGLYQLIDQGRRIIEEGSLSDCRRAMAALERGESHV